MGPFMNRLYYQLRPAVPRRIQIDLRRRVARQKRRRVGQVWPIDARAAASPPGWPGWPDGKRFALILTHDVDTARGHGRCREITSIERRLGFRSSFNFVPLRYAVSGDLRDTLHSNGFEVGLHGLYHDGKLYSSARVFRQRAEMINRFLQHWGAVGFRSPAMHCNLRWLHQLQISYDSSTFDTDPFEPQGLAVGTIFPFLVQGRSPQRRYLEIPYTLPQDFTLFVLLKEKSLDIWMQKLDWIAEHSGLALLNTHPDYMCFRGRPTFEEYPASYYEQFLQYVRAKYAGQYWHALPKDLAAAYSQSNLTPRRSSTASGILPPVEAIPKPDLLEWRRAGTPAK